MKTILNKEKSYKGRYKNGFQKVRLIDYLKCKTFLKFYKKKFLRPKRSKVSSSDGDGYWECTVCTFSNRAELFKCEMCDVRKGTSTRRPRLSQITQQFAKIETQLEEERKKREKTTKPTSSSTNRKNKNIIKNGLNLTNGQTLSVTVNGVTVLIKDYEISDTLSTSSSSNIRINKKKQRSESTTNRSDLSSYTTSSSKTSRSNSTSSRSSSRSSSIESKSRTSSNKKKPKKSAYLNGKKSSTLKISPQQQD